MTSVCVVQALSSANAFVHSFFSTAICSWTFPVCFQHGGNSNYSAHQPYIYGRGIFDAQNQRPHRLVNRPRLPCPSLSWPEQISWSPFSWRYCSSASDQRQHSRGKCARVVHSEMHLIVDHGPKDGKPFTTPHSVRSEHGYLDGDVCTLDPHLGVCRSFATCPDLTCHSSKSTHQIYSMQRSACRPPPFSVTPFWPTWMPDRIFGVKSCRTMSIWTCSRIQVVVRGCPRVSRRTDCMKMWGWSLLRWVFTVRVGSAVMCLSGDGREFGRPRRWWVLRMSNRTARCRMRELDGLSWSI